MKYILMSVCVLCLLLIAIAGIALFLGLATPFVCVLAILSACMSGYAAARNIKE